MVTECPNCGAKNAHDIMTLRCRKCGIPDEVLFFGARGIARWRKFRPISKALQRKGYTYDRQTHLLRHRRPSTWTRRHKKHGRPV